MASDDSTVAYKEVPGFPGYRVGSDGTIWSAWKRNGQKRPVVSMSWKLMRPSPPGNGYLQIGLFRDGKKRRLLIHRLVLTAFVGPCPDGMECCHNDGNRSNNVLGNLRWDTRVGNFSDMAAHGTVKRGERNGRAKITRDDVFEIRRLLAAGMFQKDVGKRFGLSQAAIGYVARRKSWGWLEDNSCAEPV